MRTTLIFIISYLLGDVVNPYYLFIVLYALSFLVVYYILKKKKLNYFWKKEKEN